jgi:TDG/mug DNA glycosylase family protein
MFATCAVRARLVQDRIPVQNRPPTMARAAARPPGSGTLHSFPPIAAPDARVLVLGSMPGVASLRQQQYYGHPHNAFWKIMGHWLGFDPAAPYAARCDALLRSRVAVWDVLASCEREGSLDASITRESIVPNNFADFFAAHPGIRRVCFNGATAAEVFRRHVVPQLPAPWAGLEFLRLPSTSPAHAGMALAAKREAWQAVRLP